MLRFVAGAWVWAWGISAAMAQSPCTATLELVSVSGNMGAGVGPGGQTFFCLDSKTITGSGSFSAGCSVDEGGAGTSITVPPVSRFMTLVGSATATADNTVRATANANAMLTVRAVGGSIRISSVRNGDVSGHAFPPSIMLAGETFQFDISVGTSVGVAEAGTVSHSGSIVITAEPVDVQPTSFVWDNPAGGAYTNPGNWNPSCDFPVHDGFRSDTAIFNSTQAGPIQVVGSNLTAGRWLIDGMILDLNGTAEILGDFAPAFEFEVSSGGSLVLDNGATLFTRNAWVGAPGTAPASSVFLSDAGTLWTTGQLEIAADSPGVVVVDQDSRLEVQDDMGMSGPAPATLRIENGGFVDVSGDVAASGSATIEVRGAGAEVSTLLSGVMAIGRLGQSASMLVQDGGYVEADSVNVGDSDLSVGQVVLTGMTQGGQRSTLSTQGLFVGGAQGTRLDVIDGASLRTVDANSTSLILGRTAQVRVNNTASALPPFLLATRIGGASWVAEGDILLGGVDERAELTVEDGGVVIALNRLDVGTTSGTSAQVTVSDEGSLVSAGTMIVGGDGRGFLRISDGARVKGVHATVGDNAGGTPGFGLVTIQGSVLSPSAWEITGDMAVGTGNVTGGVTLDGTLVILVTVGGATLDVGGTLTVGARGSILGNGTITAGHVVNGGRIEPGFSPGLVVIESDYEQLASGRLVIEYAGLELGEFDRLVVTGAATLGGRLEIHFRGGFSPEDPNAFIHSQDFVEANGGTTGDYNQRIYAFPDIFADFDGDGDKDIRDAAAFMNCFGLSGSDLEPNCTRADWEDNGILNEVEIRELTVRLTGP